MINITDSIIIKKFKVCCFKIYKNNFSSPKLLFANTGGRTSKTTIKQNFVMYLEIHEILKLTIMVYINPKQTLPGRFMSLIIIIKKYMM